MDTELIRVHREDIGDYSVEIRVRMPRPYNRELDGEYVRRAARLVERGMRQVSTDLDPQTQVQRASLECDVGSMFLVAGLGVIYVEPIANQYWPDDYVQERAVSPWFDVTTQIGHFVVGWRKRVIHIDWRRTKLGPQFDLISRGSTTHGPGFCHVSDYGDGTAVLRQLQAQLPMEPLAGP